MAKPRRVPRILALIALGATACIALRILSWYPSLVAFRSSKQTRDEKTNVLIIAHGRSGSSFLGQIFNSHPEVFYIFEPLITFQLTSMRNSTLYEHSTMRLLRDIFNCRFKQQTEFLSFMSHIQLHRFSSRVLTSPYCKNITNARDNRTFIHCKDLDPLITSLSCSLHRHTVVKVLTHRFPFLDVNRLEPLFNSGGFKFKIIHLMRDPRAVIASMDRVGWTSNNSAINTATTNLPLFTTLVQKFCLSMIQSLRFALSAEGKYPDYYRILRYEDLVRSPLNVSQELFDFAGIPMSDEVKKYLVSSTNSRDRSHSHEYGTLRNNAYKLIDAWRNQFSAEAVRAVESHCWPVLEILRYTPVFSQSLLAT
ncbi:carbohydrate sulfotransferase 1-like isoform X3 [Oculina patagonica]